MPKYVKKIYRFEKSSSPDVVGYKLYYNAGGTEPDYDSLSFDLSMPAEDQNGMLFVDLNVILEGVEGMFGFGVAGYDAAGNQASMGGILTSVPLDFEAPEPVPFAEIVDG